MPCVPASLKVSCLTVGGDDAGWEPLDIAFEDSSTREGQGLFVLLHVA